MFAICTCQIQPKRPSTAHCVFATLGVHCDVAAGICQALRPGQLDTGGSGSAGGGGYVVSGRIGMQVKRGTGHPPTLRGIAKAFSGTPARW